MKYNQKLPGKKADAARTEGEGQAEHEVNDRSTEPAPPKRPKTGGRASKSLEEKLKLGQARSQVSSWHDDTTVDDELAALYLGISKKKLEELRAPSKEAKDKQRVAAPPILKIFDPGAKGQNQPVQYKLGDLREYQRSIKAADIFDAAVKAGLAGWMTIRQPFFAHPEDREKTVIVADAWDMGDPSREDLFANLMNRRVRVVWLTPAEASRMRWTDVGRHRAFAAFGLKLLREEIAAIEVSEEATDIASGIVEKKVIGRSGNSKKRHMNPGSTD
ncbi:MAG: hypothetical protein NT123_01805 [Proteobacteria bacterium]|nr:hypothetical protein [Pseudomonadota bacterium]